MEREYNIKFSFDEILDILHSIEASKHDEEQLIKIYLKYAETDEQFKLFIKDSKAKIFRLDKLHNYIWIQYIQGGVNND